MGGTSRMNREIHVRICERLGVQFPGPTRRSAGDRGPYADQIAITQVIGWRESLMITPDFNNDRSCCAQLAV